MYFQEAKIEIRSSDDSGDSDDCDDKDDSKKINKNNNKRKRPAPSKQDTAKSNGPTHESPAKRTNRTLDDIQAENSQKIINDKALDQAEWWKINCNNDNAARRSWGKCKSENPVATSF